MGLFLAPRVCAVAAWMAAASVFVFCIQTTIITLGHLEHGLAVVHGVTTLAGSITQCAAERTCKPDGDQTTPVASHDHNEDAQVETMLTAELDSLSLKYPTGTFELADCGVHLRACQNVLERPPKS